MTPTPAEVTRVHTHLLKCSLEAEEARAYWQRIDLERLPVKPREAFQDYWFGARSMPRVRDLLLSFRARFDAFPRALQVLREWQDMDPDTRRVICHWHVQLSDPLYRAFTGEALVARRCGTRPEITLPLVVAWLSEREHGSWVMSTRIALASKLLTASRAAGLVASSRDPRPLACPRVSDEALTYLLYLLRDVDFAGSLLVNPYLASVGLEGDLLVARLRTLSALSFRRQAELVDFGWRFTDLLAWAEATVAARSLARLGAAP